MDRNKENTEIFEVLKLYANSLEDKAKIIRNIRKNEASLKRIEGILDIQKCANEMESELIHRSYCLSNYLRSFENLSQNDFHKNIVNALQKQMSGYRSEFNTSLEVYYKLE